MASRVVERLLVCTMTLGCWAFPLVASAQDDGAPAEASETEEVSPEDAPPAEPDTSASEESSDTAASQDGEDEAKPSQDEAARILALVKNANDEFDRGEYDDALRLYERAYKAYPQPVLLYRIGVSAEKSGQPRKAIEAYQTFVDASPDGDPTAAKTAQRIQEIKGSLKPRVTVTSNPEGADIFLGSVDGQPIGTTPTTLELPGGEQTLLVRLDGYQLGKETVNIPNGEDGTVDVTLQPLKRLASGEPETAVVVAEEQGDGVSLGTWGYIAGGAGIALIGTGVVFTVLKAGATDDVNTYDKRADGASREELDDLKKKATSYYEASIPLFIAGGVLTAAGVVLILLDSSSGEETADATTMRLEVAPLAGGGWIGVSGRF